jgi:hypothetical protein
MHSAEQRLHEIHARYAPVDARVQEILKNIERDCRELDPKARNAGNEHQVEAFIRWLTAQYRGRAYEVTRGPRSAGVSPEDAQTWARARAHSGEPCVVIERQRLSKWAVRTTRWNYLFTVPGESEEQILLVAHYDTWRGPGADDNTTGEEILKQYLLSDLRAATRPKLTHVYFFAGSEECGLVGLFSQLLLSFGLFAGNFALTYNDWGMLAVAIGLLPLASYRFGVSGSREYVRTLSEGELRRVRAVVSVDSVGEGRLYIPRETMGADFIRVLIPFGDYDSLNDLLEEAAHLHGVKYNNFLAGGTTDHVSFLEVNNGLLARLREWVTRPRTPPLRIPATALVAMLPGKASPIVFGGKIHTPKDTPDRVYPAPLRETLLVLDYFFYRMDGGPRISRPRELDEFHYARLYRAGNDYLVALKDAVEPNRRNLNAVYRATVEHQDGRAVARLGDIVDWGVETRLSQEVAEACGSGERWTPEVVEELEVVGDGVRLHFARRPSVADRLRQGYHNAMSAAQRVVRSFLFISFFAFAYILANAVSWALDWAFEQWPKFALWVADHIAITLTAILLLEVAVLLHLMARRIPAWIDNAYRHQNKADNLGSLRRVGA